MLTNQQIEQAHWFNTATHTPDNSCMVFAEVKSDVDGQPPRITVASLSKPATPGGVRSWKDCVTQRPVEVLRYCFQHEQLDVTQLEGYIPPPIADLSVLEKNGRKSVEWFGRRYRELLEAHAAGMDVDFVKGQINDPSTLERQTPKPVLRREFSPTAPVGVV